MKNLLIILPITATFFLLGGGWKFFSQEEMYGLWHNVHSDWEYTCTYFSMLTQFGLAQALSALFWSVLVIRLWPARQRFLWLWSFLLASLVFGGYKFFFFPDAYIYAPLAGKEYLPVPASVIGFLPLAFLVNGGGVGILAACLVAIIQKVRQQKTPNPNQAP